MAALSQASGGRGGCAAWDRCGVADGGAVQGRDQGDGAVAATNPACMVWWSAQVAAPALRRH